MSKPIKAVVDISVIPRNWGVDKWLEIAEETGYLVVDTYLSDVEDLGVQIIDEDNCKIITREEYEQRQNNKE